MTTSPVARTPADERTAPTPPTVAAVSAAALVVVGQLYAVLPFIDVFADEFGVSPTSTAWTSTAFGFAYAVGMLIAGPLSDAVGRRRVAVSGLLAGAAGAVLVTLAPSFAGLLVARAVQGLTAAFFPPVALAYLTERIAPNRRPAALTTVIGSFLAAAIVAPLAAAALSGLGGWRAWFYTSAAALLLVAALLRRVMLPDRRTHAAGARSAIAAQSAGLPRLLVRPRLLALYLGTLSVMFTFVGITTLVQLAGPGTAGHPAVMQGVRIATLPACVVVPLATPLLAKVACARRLIASMLVVACAAATTGTVAGPLPLAVALGLLTIGVAATAPALVERISEAAPHDRRGAATALYGCTLFLGAGLGTPAATVAAGNYLPTALGFAAIAVLGALAATLGSAAPPTKSRP